MTVAAPVRAADAVARPLSWGGALGLFEGTHITLWDEGNLMAGVTSMRVTPLDQTSANGMKRGGFLAWQTEGYRVDATLAPSMDGSVVAAAFGAAIGPRPGETGTSYGVQLGAAWVGDRFTVNPTTRGFGLSEVVAPSSDVNLSFTVNHRLTPSLSLIGTAEARRNVNMAVDGVTQQHRFLFGAGLGYRF